MSSSSLLLSLFDRGELAGLAIGSPIARAVSLWGPPEASGRMGRGSMLHRWGGIQVVEDAAGMVRSISVVLEPQLPPSSSVLLTVYETLHSLRAHNLPSHAQYVRLPYETEERLFRVGRVQCVFEWPSEAIVKVVIE